MPKTNTETPSNLDFPCLLVNFPFTVDNDSSNNIWMKDNKEYNYAKVYKQFMKLYSYLTDYALVYILPSEKEFQDLPFVANIGCYLPHIKNQNIILLANFKSKPRQGEEIIGRKFFTSMGYKTYQPLSTWEGEADLKWLCDNIYVGGYGIRTEIASYKWMEKKFDMKIIAALMSDQHLYHWDCIFLPLNANKAIVATAALSNKDIKILEKIVEIIDIPKKFIYHGWTNCLLLDNKIMYAPPSWDSKSTPFEKFIAKIGYEPVLFNLTEFEKSGADLSCLIMHLNYNNRSPLMSKSNNKWWMQRLNKLPLTVKSKVLSVLKSQSGRAFPIEMGVENTAKDAKIPPTSHTQHFGGFNVVIEQPPGSRRTWTDVNTGEEGETVFSLPYGYFVESKGHDGDEVDVYLGPNELSTAAYVIQQNNIEDGSFDESKVMLGFNSPEEAKGAYLSHYNNPDFFGGMTVWHTEALKRALKETKHNPKIIKARLKRSA